MKNLFRSFAAFALVLLVAGPAFAWGAAGGDGARYGQVQETAVFLNNSGSTLTSGTVVVLDTTATAGSTLGSYMTTTNSADSIIVLGVLKSSSVINGAPGVVVTRGPIDTLYAGATDNSVAAGAAVGTANGVTGQVGSGTNLGVALEATTGASDYGLIWIWVNPTNGD